MTTSARPFAPLRLGQRRQERRVADDSRGPVERADDVLRAGQVDGRLPADPRVDLAHERRRHGRPRDASHVRRRGEARHVRRRPAAERDDARRRGRSGGSSRAARARAGVFAGSPAGTSCSSTSRAPSPTCARMPWMPETCASATSSSGPSPATRSPSSSIALGLDVDAGGREQDAVDVARRARRPPPRRAAAARGGARGTPRRSRASGRSAPADALPRGLGIDVEQDRERARRRGSRASAPRGRLRRRARRRPARRRASTSWATSSSSARNPDSPSALEQLRDRLARRGLDLAVEIDEAPPDPVGDLAARGSSCPSP